MAQNFQEAPGLVGNRDAEQFLRLVDREENLRFACPDLDAKVVGDSLLFSTEYRFERLTRSWREMLRMP